MSMPTIVPPDVQSFLERTILTRIPSIPSLPSNENENPLEVTTTEVTGDTNATEVAKDKAQTDDGAHYQLGLHLPNRLTNQQRLEFPIWAPS